MPIADDRPPSDGGRRGSKVRGLFKLRFRTSARAPVFRFRHWLDLCFQRDVIFGLIRGINSTFRELIDLVSYQKIKSFPQQVKYNFFKVSKEDSSPSQIKNFSSRASGATAAIYSAAILEY
ncbi:hypothetical protein L1987_13698 [Smallanthus sonchifolius]|uniref:Uncharacterized protein n=1 Tax=Smallanthus sonchifolius TaxID=185202 RepID=A0ACB9JI56_9ASTR|nr:hypothetical protein L1987_13698 [Smallanthus sonchifolius]